MRKKIVAGNWKLNNTVKESEALASEVAELAKDVQGVDIVVCPTSVNLYPSTCFNIPMS